ncbi:MAG: Crp/Fnr family transcriptional regulator [Pyrinomonadaceae bacterium]
MAEVHNPIGNRLLALLPDDEYKRIGPHLEPVTLAVGDIVYESGVPMKHVYFPVTAIISRLYTTENGVTAQIGLVGNEGVIGTALFMGDDRTPNHAIAQAAGQALRLKAGILQDEFKRCGKFQDLLLRYTQALVTQISQTAVCNRLHSVEQQLCRWLLLSHDRIDSDVLVMTHEVIANMLGTRREGVTVAAGHLQDAGLIDYHRGRIQILNRKGLEDAVCECYYVVRDEYARLFNL